MARGGPIKIDVNIQHDTVSTTKICVSCNLLENALISFEFARTFEFPFNLLKLLKLFVNDKKYLFVPGQKLLRFGIISRKEIIRHKHWFGDIMYVTLRKLNKGC